MSENDRLHEALVEELKSTHGLPDEDAEKYAIEMRPRLRRRFGAWVRRELAIIGRGQDRGKHKTASHVSLPPGVEDREFERLSLNVRLQHATMAAAVILLVFTGLPLKFHAHAISQVIIDFFGGPDVSPIVHRIAASLLIFAGLWHLLYISFTREGRENFRLLLPGPKDAVDAFKQIRYYLGKSDERPRFDKFSYIEKFDYWAVYWGMVIMIGSGLVLWFTNLFLRYFPKSFTDIAKEAHSDEALLATLAIVIWHFYNVHFNPHQFPMNRTFITGKISAHDMIEEHPLEYERLTGHTLDDDSGGSSKTPSAPGGEA